MIKSELSPRGKQAKPRGPEEDSIAVVLTFYHFDDVDCYCFTVYNFGYTVGNTVKRFMRRVKKYSVHKL